MKKLIYIMDPHCGWCYGNSNNITDLKEKFDTQITFELMVGGMWVGNNAPTGGNSFSQFISTHSPQMEATTGAHVSDSFFQLTHDSNYVFSSFEPSAAIVLIKEIAPNQVFSFAKAVQKAIFIGGKRLDKKETYLTILNELDIETSEFEDRWMSPKNRQKTEEEINKARQLASGFPTLLLEDESGLTPLTSGFFDMKNLTDKITEITP